MSSRENITGRDFFNMAGAIRGIRQDINTTEDRTLQKKTRADRALGIDLASQGKPLPTGSSEAMTKGFGFQTKAASDIKKLEYDKTVNNLTNQMFQEYQKNGVVNNLGDLTDEGAVNIQRRRLSNQVPSPKEMSAHLEQFGKNARAYNAAQNRFLEGLLQNKNNQYKLMEADKAVGQAQYKKLTGIANELSRAVDTGDTNLANSLAIGLINDSNDQRRPSINDKGQLVISLYKDGKKAGSEVISPEDALKEFYKTSPEKYATQYAASTATAREMNLNPFIQRFITKDGKTVEAERKLWGNGRPATWRFWNEDGSEYKTKNGQYLTKLQDYRNEGFKKAKELTPKQALDERKFTADKKQQIIANKNKDIKHISDIFLKLKEDSTQFGTPFDDVATTKRAFEMAGYPEANINQKTGEILYRDKYTNGYVNAQLIPVEFGKPKKEKVIGTGGKFRDAGGIRDASKVKKGLLGRKKPKKSKKIFPKTKKELSRILNKPKTYQTGIYKTTYKPGDTPSILDKARGMVTGQLESGRLMGENKLMTALRHGGYVKKNEFGKARDMAKNLKKEYPNYTEKELIEMIKGLKSK